MFTALFSARRRKELQGLRHHNKKARRYFIFRNRTNVQYRPPLTWNNAGKGLQKDKQWGKRGSFFPSEKINSRQRSFPKNPMLQNTRQRCFSLYRKIHVNDRSSRFDINRFFTSRTHAFKWPPQSRSTFLSNFEIFSTFTRALKNGRSPSWYARLRGLCDLGPLFLHTCLHVELLLNNNYVDPFPNGINY
jgi:hypothetical protein